MQNQWIRVVLRVAVMVASTCMAIILSDANPIFSSLFSALALIETIKIAHTLASSLRVGRVSDLVEKSDMPVWAAFLFVTFMSNIGGLPGVIIKGLALFIGVAWLLWHNRQEDVQDRTLSQDSWLE